MTSKERMQIAMAHERPDRVPAVLWGSYYSLNDDTYLAVLDHLGLGGPVRPFRRYKPRNSNYYDDRILDALDTDARYIWCGFTDLGGARMEDDCRDAWGAEWKRTGPHVVSLNPPLRGASPEEIDRYPWPDPEQFMDFDLIASRATELKRRYPNKAIGARAVNSYGPFEQASVLRGREDLLMDLLTEPESAQILIDKCTDVIVRAQEIFLDRAGALVDFWEIPGDDYGGTEDLLISPDAFRNFLKARLSRIVASVKSYRNDLPVVFHTDGAIGKILADLVETGIDVLNPLEPLEATDWRAIKKDFGDRLSFMGGIDLKSALTGTPHDVEKDVQRCIETFGTGGGYVLTAANHFQGDIPSENIVTLFEAARRFGAYTP